MIPRTIHYCWFGGNPLPELSIKCIESWKKYCPDYEIKEWNEGNFDFQSCSYIKEAYESGKWAFVSDFARFWILYNYGGLYFDTDVEIIRPLDDLVEEGAFFGFEQRKNDGSNQRLVATGLGMGCEKENPIYKEMLDLYSDLHFIDEDGVENKKTVVAYMTEILQNHGLEPSPIADKSVIEVAGIKLYPWDYFCPMSYITGETNITERTYTIHHYSSSWKTPAELQMKQISEKLKNTFGEKFGGLLAKGICLPIRLNEKIKRVGLKGTVRIIMKGGAR